MSDQTVSAEAVHHGASRLPAVDVDSYNVRLRDADGFIGDRASKIAFRKLVEHWRKPLRRAGDDPFGDAKIEEISSKKLDALFKKGDDKAAGALLGAIEDFSKNLAAVIRRFLMLKDWKDTECLLIGGGLSASRIGEVILGRTHGLLKADQVRLDLELIRFDPNEAGLLGAAHLVPAWMFKGHDAILGVDIGGTNIRAGVIQLNLKKKDDLSAAGIWKSERWRHADEKNLQREKLLKGLALMLKKLVDKAEGAKIDIAPFIGVGCPGKIDEDGSIEDGAQNLPGNWESDRFNLPRALRQLTAQFVPKDTIVMLHNDAVVQGLSEVPFMRGVRRWGILTIGTGLGNARFTNRQRHKERKD
jgi:predicted NBD/HSP70 family sugar kinase